MVVQATSGSHHDPDFRGTPESSRNTRSAQQDQIYVCRRGLSLGCITRHGYTSSANLTTPVHCVSLLPDPRICAKTIVQWTDASIVWLTSLMWGEIYVHNISPLGIWAFTSVRLFHVKQNQQRALVGSVSDVVGGLLGRSTSDSG